MKTLALGSTVLTAEFIQGISFAACSAPSPTPDPTLKAAFDNAVIAFNNHDPSIGGVLAKNVIASTLSENYDAGGGQKTKTVYNGLTKVEGFFKKSFGDNPKFTPDSGYTYLAVGKSGIVSGTACWVDTNSPNGETISFMFQWVNPGSGWLIKHLYAD